MATLAEENDVSVALSVDALGVPGATALLRRTLALEATGGMPTADGGRRRTPGGVYFALLRDAVSAEAFKAIFAHKAAAHNAALNARRRRDAVLYAASKGRPLPGRGGDGSGGGRGGGGGWGRDGGWTGGGPSRG